MSEFPRFESTPLYEGEELKYRLRDIRRDANAGISFEVVSPSVRGEVSFRIQDFNVFAFENTDSPQIIFESNMTPEQKRLLAKAIRDGVICETFMESRGERRKVYLPNLNHPSVDEARVYLTNDNADEIQGKSYYDSSSVGNDLNFNIISDPNLFAQRDSFFNYLDRRFTSIDSETQEEIAVEFILSNGVTFQIRGSEISNATYNGRSRAFTIEEASEKNEIIKQALKAGLLSKVFVRARDGENRYKFYYIVNPTNVFQYGVHYDPDYYDELDGIDGPLEGDLEEINGNNRAFDKEQRRRRQELEEDELRRSIELRKKRNEVERKRVESTRRRKRLEAIEKRPDRRVERPVDEYDDFDDYSEYGGFGG